MDSSAPLDPTRAAPPAADAPPADVVVLDLSLGDGRTITENVKDIQATGRAVLVHSIADRAAGGLKRIRDTDGRKALAGFGSAKGSNEEAYLFQKLVRLGFGTNPVIDVALLERTFARLNALIRTHERRIREPDAFPESPIPNPQSRLSITPPASDPRPALPGSPPSA